MCKIRAKIIADSCTKTRRLITIETVYPRIVHAEVLRHRNFSHSVSSSRAIPTAKLLEAGESHGYFTPKTWRRAAKGMSPGEFLNEDESDETNADHDFLYRITHSVVERMAERGVSKEQANRYLEPFMYVTDLMTGTLDTWTEFIRQRTHPAAQYEIRELAALCLDAIEHSCPRLLEPGGWHAPYLEPGETELKLSAARCARVSYLRQDNRGGEIERADQLISDGHWSPFEHQARPMMPGLERLQRNLVGWVQFRAEIESWVGFNSERR